MKLNKKGFTLIELLAVIIILAIVVGITIPAIMNSVNDARKKGFETAANTAADWLERQAQSYAIGDETISPVDAAFKAQCLTNSTPKTVTNCSSSEALIKAAGLKTTNVSSLTATYSNGRYCVTLTAAENGDYKSVADTMQGGSC